jgi:hypothetical protein
MLLEAWLTRTLWGNKRISARTQGMPGSVVIALGISPALISHRAV